MLLKLLIVLMFLIPNFCFSASIYSKNDKQNKVSTETDFLNSFEGNGFSSKSEGQDVRQFSFTDPWKNGAISPSQSFKRGANPFDFNENYIKYALKNFKCPPPSEIPADQIASSSVTLKNINFVDGHYLCSYSTDKTSLPFKERLFSFGNKPSLTAQDELAAFTNFELKKNFNTFPSFSNYIGNFKIPGNKRTEISYKLLYEDILRLDARIKRRENKFIASDGTSDVRVNHLIDSHTRPEATISAGLAGLITLNPDYFKDNKFILENGEINLKDYIVSDNNSPNLRKEELKDKTQSQKFHSAVDSVKSGVGRLIGFISDKFSREGKINGANQYTGGLNLYDFIDKYLWGFYVYMLENLRFALSSILIGIVFLGTIFAGGTILGQKVKYQMLSGDSTQKNKQDNTPIKSKALDIFLIMFIFAIPISNIKISVPKKFMYLESTIESKSTSTEDKEKNERLEFYSNATISQTAIRFFAEKGAGWANKTSDYLLYSYLRYIESKSAFFASSDAVELKNRLISLHQETFLLKKNSDFYNNVCLPTFYMDLNKETGTLMEPTSKAENKAQKKTPISQSLYRNLGIKKVDYNLCRRIEQDIDIKTKSIVATFKNIEHKRRVIKETMQLEDVDELFDRQMGFKEFATVMGFMQKNLGWINVAAVPVSYQFFTAGNGVFLLNEMEEDVSEDSDDGTSVASAYQNVDPDKISSLEGGSGWVFSTINGAFVYTMLPGFFKAVTTLDEKISRVFQTKLDRGKKSAAGFLSSIVSKGAKMIGNTVPALKPITLVIRSLTSGSNNIAVGLRAMIIFTVSFLIILALYKLMISIATMIVLSTVIMIKITLYFIELLIYFVVSDAVIFWSIVSDRSEYMKTFLGKGLVTLLITPTVIVISVYVFIFTSNLMRELYTFMVKNTNDMLVMANETIVRQNAKAGIDIDNGHITAIGKQFTISIYTAFGEMIVELLGIVLAILVIFKFKDWILQMVGHKDDSISSSAATSIQDKLTPYASPIK